MKGPTLHADPPPVPPPQPKPFRSIAASLVWRTVAVAVAVGVLAAGLQTLFTLRDERARFDRSLRAIAETNLPLLSVALWDIEPEAIRRQLRQIANQPEIAYVRLEERAGHVFEAGDAGRRNLVEANVLEITNPQGRDGSIGTLEITANREALYRSVASRMLEVVLGYVLLAAAICIVVVAVLRLELERPMRHLARFTAELTPDQLTTPLRLERPRRRHRDEIDLVAEGFKTLQDGIQAHVSNLDAQVAIRTAQLESALAEIKELTITDSLTGCFNRRHLDLRLLEEVLRAQRSAHPLSVVISDIDNFKTINDRLGHAAGDAVLRGLAELFRGAMREKIDWVARYGGEEFVIVLPNSDLKEANAIAERLRAAVEASMFSHGKFNLRITASFGVAECNAGDNADGLLARADAMLYKAKDAGRNKVFAAEDAVRAS